MAHNIVFFASSSAESSTPNFQIQRDTPTLPSISSAALADIIIDAFTALRNNGGEKRPQLLTGLQEASPSSKDKEDQDEIARTKIDLMGRNAFPNLL